MSLYKFEKDDLFYNRIKTYPTINFYIYDGVVIYNRDTQYEGDLNGGDNIKNVPPGFISLYELNVDRPADQLIYPFIEKGGSLTTFKTITTSEFNNDFVYGDIVTGSYPLAASISSDRFAQGVTGKACRYYRSALENNLNSYQPLSPHYAFSSSLGDKGDQELQIISIPSIFYGSSIKKGSCSLKFFVTGTLVNELRDNVENGELRQVFSGSLMNSGAVAGVVMYNEGFIILTGSWALNPGVTDNYGTGPDNPRWVYFAFTGSTASDSSFQMSFSGTNYVPTLTMFAHLPKGELNYSNNPTYLKHGQSWSLSKPLSSSAEYIEPSNVLIENIVKSNFNNPTASLEKITYVNKVAIYDKYRNLIGIAKLATPVRKRQTDEFTFKLKLDF